MKLEVLGLNHFDSRSATCQTVRPRSSALSSGHSSFAPPQGSSTMPRLSRYHAANRLWSDVDLKKTPPIPVTRAIATSPLDLSRRLVFERRVLVNAPWHERFDGRSRAARKPAPGTDSHTAGPRF